MSRRLRCLLLAASACGGSPVQGRHLVESGNTLTYTTTPVDYSGEDDFNWLNDNSGVAVTFAGTVLTSGSVQVTILDPKGDQVLSPTFDDGGSTVGENGQPGQWQIEVVYRNATGTVEMTANGG